MVRNAAVRQLNTVVKQKQQIYQRNRQEFEPTHNFKLLSYISLNVQQEDLSKMSAECQKLESNRRYRLNKDSGEQNLKSRA